MGLNIIVFFVRSPPLLLLCLTSTFLPLIFFNFSHSPHLRLHPRSSHPRSEGLYSSPESVDKKKLLEVKVRYFHFTRSISYFEK